MNIDVIVAKLQKRGLSETNAKNLANKVSVMAREFGIPVTDLVNEINNFSFNELGDFFTNTIAVKGYKTGKVVKRTSSDIVSRTIIK